MVSYIVLDDRRIYIKEFVSDAMEGKKQISVRFDVSHEDYHEITTLLYKGEFVVRVPEKELEFPAVITSYATSITNLYEQGNTGEFHLTLKSGE
ncbi:DUF3219 family protein [Alkalicoccus daliensis]|uniref:DUF3219 family protein n=1 Tax=Alkalicoccus daliensis TaxID=745820 RepID=A0A1H0E280_9BACI|nr:DUF3219 family protein [Alkalicoccus daliensis]SDN76459.1 Protein of unknown function [Alkalicoccus daliensis]